MAAFNANKITIKLSERVNTVELTQQEKDWLTDYTGESKNYYFKGSIEEILINGVADNDFLKFFNLAVVGDEILTEKWPWILYGSVVLILTDESDLHNRINGKILKGDDFFFAPDTPVNDSELPWIPRLWKDFNAVQAK